MRAHIARELPAPPIHHLLGCFPAEMIADRARISQFDLAILND